MGLHEGKLFWKSRLLPKISLLNQSSSVLVQIRVVIPHGRFNRRERGHNRLDLRGVNTSNDDDREEKKYSLTASLKPKCVPPPTLGLGDNILFNPFILSGYL